MWEELASLAPGGGFAGSVIALFAWFSKTSREDRKEYRESLAAAKLEFEERLKTEHGRLLETEMHAQTEIDELRRRLGDMETVVQGERARRRDAEIEVETARIKLEQVKLRLSYARGEEVV